MRNPLPNVVLASPRRQTLHLKPNRFAIARRSPFGTDKTGMTLRLRGVTLAYPILPEQDTIVHISMCMFETRVSTRQSAKPLAAYLNILNLNKRLCSERRVHSPSQPLPVRHAPVSGTRHIPHTVALVQSQHSRHISSRARANFGITESRKLQ